MPRSSRPLPPVLAGTAFTRDDVRAHGVSTERLRARDIRHITRGAHRLVSDAGLTWQDLGYAAAVADFPPEEAPLVVRLSGGVASHLTALRLHGVVEPTWLRDDGRLHVSRPHSTGRSERPGVVTHARTVLTPDVVTLHGMQVTSLERTWSDLCSMLRPGQVKEAVIAGDALVRRPWVAGERIASRTTIPLLRDAVQRAGRFKGVRVARAALHLVRVGADSPMETELRLALLDAGLPEPQLQVVLRTAAGEVADADMVVTAARVALHYDGGHHRTPEQQARDARRDRLWQEAGHLSLTVTVRDRRDDFRAVVAAVRRRGAALDAALPLPDQALSNGQMGECGRSRGL